MLRINIIAVGKNKESWVEDSIAHYIKHLKKFSSVNMIYLPDIKKAKNLSESEIKKREAGLILDKARSDYKIALDVRGSKYSSEQFSKFIERLLNDSGSNVDFIIGGAFGLDQSLLDVCRNIISLSSLTMSHQLIRPVLLEQLYRGFSILSGGKYHK